MKISINNLTPELFLELYTAVGWEVSLELISTQEAVAFYKRQGFEERPCDWDGPGMFQMVRKN